MQRLLSLLFYVFLTCGPAYAQTPNTKAQIESQINSQFPDNTSGAITPETVRNFLKLQNYSYQQTTQALRANPSTSDTIGLADYGNYVIETNSAAIAVSLPALNVTYGAFNYVQCAYGTGAATITPVVGTINGTTTWTVYPGSCITVVWDQTDSVWKVKFEQLPVASFPTLVAPNSTLDYIPVYNHLTGALNKAVPGSIGGFVGVTDYYVNKSLGSDSNACVAPGASACATINHAMSLATTFKVYAGAGPTIHVATGTGPYTEQVSCTYPIVGAAGMEIVGDQATPANIAWTPPNGAVGLLAFNGCNVTLSGFHFTSAGTPCAYLDTFNGQISFYAINFGLMNASAGCGEHILADHNGIINILDTYSVTANATYHILAVGPATIQHVEAGFTMPNTVTITSFYSLSGPAQVNYDQTVVCTGSGCASGSTGAQATLSGPGSIATNGSVIPGSLGYVNQGGFIDGASAANSYQFNVGAYAGLGTCNSAAAGVTKFISNSNTAVWGATISGTGANGVVAVCNGANWTVMGL